MRLYLFLIVAYSSFFSAPLDASERTSLLHQFCSSFFGSATLPVFEQIYFDQAAENCELHEDQKPPIRYVCTSKLHNTYLNGLAHFNWFGIWVNKLAWTRMNEKEKRWAAHHEIAHTALYHPQKQISAACTVTIAAALLIKSLQLNPASLLLIPTTLAITIPYFARYYEKEADIYAAKTLSKCNGKDIIEDHIASLEHQTDEWSLWFYKPSEQIKYLREALFKVNSEIVSNPKRF